jgi:hypothetical protein
VGTGDRENQSINFNFFFFFFFFCVLVGSFLMSRDVVLGTIAGTFGAAAGLFTKLTLGGLPEQPGPLMVPVYALLPADLPGAG